MEDKLTMYKFLWLEISSADSKNFQMRMTIVSYRNSLARLPVTEVAVTFTDVTDYVTDLNARNTQLEMALATVSLALTRLSSPYI